MIANAENTCTTVKIIRHIVRSTRPGPENAGYRHSGPLSRSLQNGQKFISLERRAADQTTVHIRHRKQLRRITGLHTAAVQNAGCTRYLSIPGPYTGADGSMDFLCLLRCRGAASPDRPYRLVSHHSLAERFHATQLQHGVELARHNLGRTARVPLRKLLPHAQYGNQSLRM